MSIEVIAPKRETQPPPQPTNLGPIVDIEGHLGEKHPTSQAASRLPGESRQKARIRLHGEHQKKHENDVGNLVDGHHHGPLRSLENRRPMGPVRR